MLAEHFQNTRRHHEPGMSIACTPGNGFWGYALGWDFVNGGVHYTYTPGPTTPIAMQLVRNGNVQTEGGLTHTSP